MQPDENVKPAVSTVTDRMSKMNWMITAAGIGLFLLGFVLLYFVKQAVEGPMGLIAPLTVLLGIVITPIGLVIKK